MPTASRRAVAPSPPAQRLSVVRQRWEESLSSELGRAVEVRFNRARCEPVRWSWAPRGKSAIDLRLHERFACAPDDVRAALAQWIRSGKRARNACALLDRWIADEIEPLPRRARRQALQPVGRVHDLAMLSRELLEGAFATDFPDGDGAPLVTWGRRTQSRSRGSLRLGSYVPDDNLVRLHPVLDAPQVPDWFVRYVLFHEHLHAALPPRPGRGERWIHHGAEFRRREQRYPDYRRALAWEHDNLPALVRRARRKPGPTAPDPMPARAATVDEPSLIARPLRLLQRTLFGRT
jgi:hypothetical protein